MSWWDGNEWDLFKKAADGFGLLVEMMSWKFILIGIPLIGLAVAIFAPLIFGG